MPQATKEAEDENVDDEQRAASPTSQPPLINPPGRSLGTVQPGLEAILVFSDALSLKLLENYSRDARGELVVARLRHRLAVALDALEDRLDVLLVPTVNVSGVASSKSMVRSTP